MGILLVLLESHSETPCLCLWLPWFSLCFPLVVSEFQFLNESLWSIYLVIYPKATEPTDHELKSLKLWVKSPCKLKNVLGTESGHSYLTSSSGKPRLVTSQLDEQINQEGLWHRIDQYPWHNPDAIMSWGFLYLKFQPYSFLSSFLGLPQPVASNDFTFRQWTQTEPQDPRGQVYHSNGPIPGTNGC